MNDPLGKKHRRSIRLQDYDYSTNGLYFVTICVNKRLELFGDIIDGKMILNNAGKMVDEILCDMPEYNPEILIDTHIIMPNHIHIIIGIENVGATHCGRPDVGDENIEEGKDMKKGEDSASPLQLGVIVGRFKTMTTNRYIKNVHENSWESFHQKLWQRNYYEHIIRNDKELEKTRYYISENPLKWDDDTYNSANDKKGVKQ